MKLKELTTKIGSGATPTGGKHAYLGGSTALIRSQNVLDFSFSPNGLAYINDEQAAKLNNVNVKENDVLLNITGDSIARCCMAPADVLPARVNQHVSIIRAREEINPRFLMYWLQWRKEYLLRICGVGGTRNALTKEAVEELDIIYPENAASIADLLSALDNKIANNKKLMTELEETARLIYDYWFTQFDFPDKNGNPYRSSGGAMVYNETLHREIPADWKVVTLGDVCSFKNGVNYDKDNMVGKICKIVNVRDISSSTLFINQVSLDGIELPESLVENYRIGAGDILIARSGTPGAVRLIDKPEDIIFCGFIICCSPNKDEFKNYLTLLLKQYEGTSATVTGGSILKNVSQDTLKRIQLVIPPVGTARAFNAVIDKLLAQLVRAEEENTELTSLRDWLLPMLMNGQVQIGVFDEAD